MQDMKENTGGYGLRKRKKLGELLVEHGVISAEELQHALEEQKKKLKRLGDVLVELGYVSNETILKALAEQISVETINLKDTYIDADVARLIPKELAKRHTAIPVRRKDGTLYVAMADPRNVNAIDDLRVVTQMDIRPLLAAEEDIGEAIELYYTRQISERAIEDLKRDWTVEETIEAGLDETEIENAPAVRLAKSIIMQAVAMRASDIHLEPFERQVTVRYRVDGTLVEVMTIPMNLYPAVLTRFKVISGINIAEKRLPQDGRIEMSVSGKEYDFRVSTLPTVFGEKVVIRILDRTSFQFTRRTLGFRPHDNALLDKILAGRNGIILVTGPTGSGKSTTLYALMREMNTPEVNIVTIEDPVEYMLEGINQVQVNVKAGLTFATGLRSILRQDPDIVMIGEIRDEETAQIAVRASITGHLVLSTLHTNDAPSSVARLIDMGIPPYLLADALSGIIAQRLVRRLCPECKERYGASASEAAMLDIPENTPLWRPVGCPKCNGTGYSGRVAIHEVMHINRPIREAIQRNAGSEVLRDLALENGMRQLFDSCREAVLEGQTSVSEMVKTVYVRD